MEDKIRKLILLSYSPTSLKIYVTTRRKQILKWNNLTELLKKFIFFGNVSENDQRIIKSEIVGHLVGRDRLGH